MSLILTPRLRLVPLTAPILRALLADDYENADELAGFRLIRGWETLSRWIVERRLAMIEADPSQEPWLVRAIVTHDNEMIGRIGFHHKAGDPDLQKFTAYGAELGYTIEPTHQRQGYATEAASAMMQWAFQQHDVRSFFLSISPNNVPSMNMALKLGFREVGSHIDDKDGLELVLRADVGQELNFHADAD